MLQHRKGFFAIWFCLITAAVQIVFSVAEKQNGGILGNVCYSEKNRTCTEKITCPACLRVGWHISKAPYIMKQTERLSTIGGNYTGIFWCKYIGSVIAPEILLI